MFSFYGLIDLLAVLLVIVMGDFNTSIRLLRVLRLIKLIRYLKALEFFIASLQNVLEKTDAQAVRARLMRNQFIATSVA